MLASIVSEGLASYGFFDALTAEGRSRLVNAARPLHAGPSLFRQEGDACSALTLLSTGQVQVLKRRSAGREIVLYRFGPGELCVLEALAVLTGAGYRAEAVIERSVTGVSVPAEAFRDLVESEPALRAFLFTSFEARLAMVLTLVSEVALASLEARLAAALLRHAQPSSDVHATHEQLARELACGREAVSRLLGSWERAGIVSLGRGRLVVTDPARLALLAGDAVPASDDH